MKLVDVSERILGVVAHVDQLHNMFNRVHLAITGTTNVLSSNANMWNTATSSSEQYAKAIKDSHPANLAALKEEADQLNRRLQIWTKVQKKTTAALAKERDALEATRLGQLLSDQSKEARAIRAEAEGVKQSIEAAQNKLGLFKLSLKSAVSGFAFTLVKASVERSYAFNRAMAEGNTNIEERNRLWKEGELTSFRTGASQDDILNAMQAMRTRSELYAGSLDKGLNNAAKAGQRMTGTFQESLDTASRLSFAFKLSSDQLTRLVQVAQISGMSLTEVANEVDKVVHRTSLSWEDMIKTSETVSKTAFRYGYHTTAIQSKAMQDMLAGLEDSLKAVGAPAGTAISLYEKLTAPMSPGSLMFGGGPAAAVDPRKFEEMLTKITNMVGPSASPWGVYSGVTGGLAGMFKLTPDEIQWLQSGLPALQPNIEKLHDATNTVQTDAKNQMILTGGVWEQLKNQAIATTDLGAMPLVKAMQKLNAAMQAVSSSTPSVIDKVNKILGGAGGPILSTLYSLGAGGMIAKSLFDVGGKLISWIRTALKARAAAAAVAETVETVATEAAPAVWPALSEAAVAGGGAATAAGTATAVEAGAAAIGGASLAATVAVAAAGLAAGYGLGMLIDTIFDISGKVAKLINNPYANSDWTGGAGHYSSSDWTGGAGHYSSSDWTGGAGHSTNLKNASTSWLDSEIQGIIISDVESSKIEAQKKKLEREKNIASPTPLQQDRETLGNLELALKELVDLAKREITTARKISDDEQMRADQRARQAKDTAMLTGGSLFHEAIEQQQSSFVSSD